MPAMRSCNYYKSLSAESLYDDLLECCGSHSLSEDSLREIIEWHELKPNVNRLGDYEIFFNACCNIRVTEGIIRCLLKYFPDAASVTDHTGWSPLHYACGSKNVTPNVIKLLIEAAPDSVRICEDNVEGWMPLHSLCDNGNKVNEATAIQIMKLLVEKHPEAVRHADRYGYLPIHLACVSRSPEFCQVLIDSAPDSLLSENIIGWTPLHVLCGNREVRKAMARQKLKLLIEKCPEAVRHADNDGKLPIHHACWSSRSAGFCQVLIDAAPDSVRSVTNEGLTPLHVLCGNIKVEEAMTRQILNLLIEKHPEAVRDADNYGYLPIHLACCASRSAEFCQVLIDLDPDSVRSMTNEGLTPLHLLCENKEVEERTAIQIMNLLFKKHPEGVRHADGFGELPIHLASRWRSLEFCRVLIEAYPGSEQITDSDGALPLHRACGRGTLFTVEYLYSLYPDAISYTNTNGFYPIHYAIHSILNRDNPATAVVIVKFLLDCDPIVNLQKSSRGRSLLHHACRKDYNDSNIEAGLEIIGAIYDAHPEAIENDGIATNIHRCHQEVQAFVSGELAYAHQAKDLRLMTTPDDNGRLSLHTALQNNARLGSIKLLVGGNPHALQSPDNSGAIPLHVACQHHDSTNVIQFLVELDTKTIGTADSNGNAALHYACRGAKYDTIALFLEKYDAVSVSRWNADKKFPIDLLWESNGVEDRGSDEYTESVFRLLQAYPETILNYNPQDQAKAGAGSS